MTQITKRADDAVASTISLQKFADAMRSLDLTGVPPHKRYAAIQDHLARIQSETMANPTHREAIKLARELRQKQDLISKGIIVAQPEG